MVNGWRKLCSIMAAYLVLVISISLTFVSLQPRSNHTVVSATNPLYKPGRVLVRFKQQVGRHLIATTLDNINAVQTGTVYGSDVIILKVVEGEEQKIIANLSEHPDVLYAEPDFRYAITSVPDDPFYGAQWAHTKLHSNQAWDITTGGTSIKIAIIDTGIDATHPDLTSKLLPGQSFLKGQQDSNPVDLHGHGTHIAGIAAAATDNTAGVAGMSWGARIIPVRVLDNEGEGWTTDIAAGINWARNQGADIINLSLGGEAESMTMRTAVQDAYNAGVLVVASMGNDYLSTPYYPAAYDNVLAVTATTMDNDWAFYANYGTHTDIAAPGGYMTTVHDSNGILSTMPTYPVFLTTVEHYSTYYDTMFGTSQATPFISGLAALIWSADASLSADAVSNVITSTAVDLGEAGWDQYFGYGLADAKAALDSINQLESAPFLYAIDNADQDGNYLVQWTAVDRATSYRLEMSSDTGFGMPTLVYVGAGTENYVNAQLTGRWYYRVMASNVSGNSPWSQIVDTGVLPDQPVLMPVSSGSEPDAYTLSWTAVTGAKGYVLQQADDITFTHPVTRYIGVDLQHYISGEPGGEWLYRVNAFNNVGSSLWSNIQSKSVPTASLDAPELLPIDNADGDAAYEIQWTTVPSATIYALEESRSLYFHKTNLAYVGPLTALTVADQAKGTWYYRVRGYSATTYSSWSTAQKAIVISHIYTPLILRQYTAPLPSSYLYNGNFEAGGTGWVQYSLKGYPLIVNRSFAGMQEPYEGDWAVWMGGDFGEIAYIQQEVQIYASTPYLSFWHWIDSEETECGVDNINLIVNSVLVESYNLCLVQNTGDWVQHSVDLSPYTGGKATFVLRVRTDLDLNSNYFVDDMAFTSSPILNTGAVKPGVGLPPGITRKPESD